MNQKLDFTIRRPLPETIKELERAAASLSSESPLTAQQMKAVAVGTIAALHWCSDLDRIITTLSEQTTLLPKPATKDIDESLSVPR